MEQSRNKEKVFYIIECGMDHIEYGLLITDSFDKKNYQYIMTVTLQNGLQVSKVTEQEFDKYNKRHDKK